jgi:MFS family permease
MSITERPVGKPVTSLRKNRSFLLLWLGVGVSNLGSTVAAVGFPLLLVFYGRSTVEAGWVGFAGLLPLLLIQLPAGVFVDRWDRRRTMIWCDVACLVGIGSVGVALLLDVLWLPHIMAAAFVEGTASIFYRLAERAAVSNVVAPEQLSTALSQNEARGRAAGLVGQPLSGAIFTFAKWAPFLFTAVMHTFALVSLLFIKDKFQRERVVERRDLRAELAEGISWLFRQRFLRSALLLMAVTNVLFQVLSLSMVVIVRDHGASPAVVGVIGAASGVGGVLGALSSSFVMKRVNLVTVMIGTLASWAVLMFGISTVPPLVPLAVLYALTTFLGALMNVVAGTYQMSITPDEMQGRIGSVGGLMASGANSLGALTGGFLLAAFSTSTTVAAISVVMFAVAVAALATPAIRAARHSQRIPR